MKRHVYRERDYAFAQLVLTLRTAIGLSQAGLAERLGASRRAVADWEGGLSYPKTDRLKELIELGMQRQAFPAGREEEEIRALWKAAHQKVWLDEAWLHNLLASPQPVQLSQRAGTPAAHNGVEPATSSRVDLVEALDVSHFTGREMEVAELSEWILQERCRLVTLLGIGGIGKSMLASFLGSRLVPHFEAVLWRFLRDAPACEALVADCLTFFSETPPAEFPISLEQRITHLVARLQASRCLLVLDNLEALLASGDPEGSYLPGYEGYGRLIERLAESAHQSCVLLTSRERPREIEALEGTCSPVRSLRLDGVDEQTARVLLGGKGLSGTSLAWQRLVAGYAGNPLALKIVAQAITDLFGGELDRFLQEGELIFNGVRPLLRQQVGRLSPLEHLLLTWLAVLREWTPLDTLAQAQAKDYVRENQVRLLAQPLLERLRAELGADAQVEAHLLRQLSQFRTEDVAKEGYGPANLLSILTELRGHLRGLDLSRLFIRGASLQGVELQDTVLAGALLQDCAFTEPFDAIASVAVSRSGHYWAAASRRGEVRVWRVEQEAREHLHLARRAHTDVVRALAFSPDERTLASGSPDGSVKLWERGEEGSIRLRQRLLGHTGRVICLDWSPDGATLASGSFDHTIRLWEAQEGRSRLVLQGHTAVVNSLVFTPDSRYLLSGSEDGTLRLWEVQRGQVVRALEGYTATLYDLDWSPDGTQIASAGSNTQVSLWQVTDRGGRTPRDVLCGRCLEVIRDPDHSDNVFWGVAWSPDGCRLVGGADDGHIYVWDASDGTLLQRLAGHQGAVCSLACSPDGTRLAS